ncbi:PLDc_N domain-containing protein [Candidatus Dojkabacteria bacterium]|uniref:PLDc_N domain-containing protein n=1 Tax=Candidatus Dojkabacteria bacterium TaxID=2099670 RepID=A0A955L7W2_9BACT|nr:PLDc_N domain-containing protein [Candidatus Dojkabacteria bacterium]
MKQAYRNFLATGFVLAASVQPAFAATCTLNGQVVPCDQMPAWFWLLICCSGILAIGFSVFWIMMLVDLLKHDNKDKVMWLLALIFLNFFGAALYYFMVKRKRS